ncbi:aminoglycoside phosphotransferase family protein [Streptomyces sp. NPDC047130]|uniref:aminoglycoside phosphotransferase family protein n=1 Tax=Streptomyces sp. NPDC047130 TaxID=3155261 RepID=UPI0033EEE633
MEPADLRRAVEAARATARTVGLRADDVVVVHDSDRVALRLLPCDTLVRVAPSANAAEGAFEVEVARRLADAEAPVAGLDPRTEPRLHRRDGFVLSFWTYYAPVAGGIAPAAYADVLARHHAALRRADLDGLAVPHVTDRVAAALAEVSDPERSPDLADPDRDLLLGTLGRLGAGLGPGRSADRLLHGEPHSGNLLHTARGPLLVDLVTCCRGPVEFDLGHVPEDVAAHYPGADPDLVARCRAVNWAMFSAWRWRRHDRMPDREHWRAAGLDLVRTALARRGRD